MIYQQKQQKIAEKIDPVAGVVYWQDWKWQLKNSIKDIATFESLTQIHFDQATREKLEATTAKFPLSITPYYLSLIDVADYENDPVFKQAFPDARELIVQDWEMPDPLAEETDSPAPGITHRYPDRVLFHISNLCAMYCRHCTRKRKVGDVGSIPDRSEIRKGLSYIRNNSAVRDVLLSGGD
ncbi:MAG: lysine 2,3-aminomutase, partial [Bacillota bacterium]